MKLDLLRCAGGAAPKNQVGAADTFGRAAIFVGSATRAAPLPAGAAICRSRRQPHRPLSDSRHRLVCRRPALESRPTMFGAPPKELPQKLAFLLVPNFSMIAFTSAVEPLRLANRASGKQLYAWHLFS